jgi:AcrR family transcriptional regulator
MPPQATPTDVVQARVRAGLVAAVSRRGYAAVTINDIVAAAQISKSTFYAHYADKEECFLATYELVSEQVLAVLVEAADPALPDEDRVLSATTAYLTTIAGDPTTARTFILEVLAAGPAALAKRHDVNRRFADVLRRLVETRSDTFGSLSPATALVVVGGINELVLSAIVEDRLAELPALAPDVARVVLGAVTRPAPQPPA